MLALYDADKNFVEYREGGIYPMPEEGFDESYPTLPGEDEADMLCELAIGDRSYNYSERSLKSIACEDGFYYFEGGDEDYNPDKGYGVFEKGYVKPALVGEQSFIIYDKNFEPTYKVKNGAMGYALIEGKLIWGLVTDEDFINLENGEHMQIEEFHQYYYREKKFDNGHTYINDIGITNQDNELILAFRNSPYQRITDPVTNKHYISFMHDKFNSYNSNTMYSNVDFVSVSKPDLTNVPEFAREDYSYMYMQYFEDTVRLNRLYCIEDEAFVNIDFVPNYHDIVTIIDSKLELSINNNDIPYLISSHEGYGFDNNNKGAYEIYDISDPSDPQLLFHYNEKDNVVIRDLSQQ